MSRKTDAMTYEDAVEVLRYDAQTGVLERKLKSGDWRVCGHKPTSHGYGQVGIDGKIYLAHRLAWLLTYGEWPDVIDHLDRDRINNRISNLREVTPAENTYNHGVRRDNTSGYTGVTFHAQTSKYRAVIWLNGKPIHLGLYSTPEEAFTAYMLAKIEHHPSSPDAQQYLRELALAG